MITPQVPRGDRLRRRRHRAAPRPASRAAGQVADLTHRRDGADDDRRHRRSAHAPSASRTGKQPDRAGTRRPLRRRRRGPARRSRPSNLKVHAGEIVGIAGVSGNGQSELVEVLSGQRAARQTGASSSTASPSSRRATRCDTLKVFGLPEEPLRNATVPTHARGREHRLPLLRQAADHQPRLVAVARPDAREGARADRPLPGQDAVDRDAHRQPLRRQRAARGAGARTVGRRRRADRRQPLLRARLRLGGRDPLADHGAAQPGRGRAAGVARTSTRSWNSPTAWR